jgi:hypothetical protein
MGFAAVIQRRQAAAAQQAQAKGSHHQGFGQVHDPYCAEIAARAGSDSHLSLGSLTIFRI